MLQLAPVTISTHLSKVCGRCGTDKDVFLRLVAEVIHRFLGQRFSIKICINLGRNVSETRAMLS
jgi:hypothetical protein